jgi:hypothetical protein
LLLRTVSRDVPGFPRLVPRLRIVVGASSWRRRRRAILAGADEVGKATIVQMHLRPLLGTRGRCKIAGRLGRGGSGHGSLHEYRSALSLQGARQQPKERFMLTSQ